MRNIIPKKCTEEHLKYLDELRESGVTNMFGATPYLYRKFSELSITECQDIHFYWMETFNERTNKQEINSNTNHLLKRGYGWDTE